MPDPSFPPFSRRPRQPSAVRQAAGIVAAGTFIALIANAVSPQGIPLVGDFSKGAALANMSEAELAQLPSEIDTEGVAATIAAADSLGAIVIDARLPDDYEAGHIPGALNLPADTFDEAYPALADTLKSARQIIVYCDGGDCELSHNLANLLKEHGHEGIRLFAAGLDGWLGEGRPVNEGSEP
jgi:rhodanese-related sulfurtransferase